MADLFTWWARRLALPRRKTEQIAPGVTTSYIPDLHRTFDTELPWIVYTFGRVHDGWWPLWRSSRLLGRASVGCECAVCGRSTVVVARMPRFGEVNPEAREHPDRVRFKLEHLHRDRPHPMAWARPLLNRAAREAGVDLDLLAMRLEADLKFRGPFGG